MNVSKNEPAMKKKLEPKPKEGVIGERGLGAGKTGNSSGLAGRKRNHGWAYVFGNFVLPLVIEESRGGETINKRISGYNEIKWCV